jgi:hypothetical protein
VRTGSVISSHRSTSLTYCVRNLASIQRRVVFHDMECNKTRPLGTLSQRPEVQEDNECDRVRWQAGKESGGRKCFTKGTWRRSKRTEDIKS